MEPESSKDFEELTMARMSVFDPLLLPPFDAPFLVEECFDKDCAGGAVVS
jgi:hypothetical protein